MEAPLRRPIYLTFYNHFDYPGRGPDDPAGRHTSDCIKATTELFERYGVKAHYGVTGLVVQNLAEDHPETLERIRRLRIPVGYHGDHVHVPNPLRRVRGLDWMEALRVTWRYETHRLNPATGEVYPDRIGGWLGVQKLLGVTPLPTDVAGKGGIGPHEYVLSRLGAASYPVRLCFPVDAEEVVCLPELHEPHQFPGRPRLGPPQYPGSAPGEDTPMMMDPVEWLETLAENVPRERPGRVSFMCHANADFEEVDRILRFVMGRPEDFRVVWPDMEASQYRAENRPAEFYRRAYGIEELEELMELELPPRWRDRALTLEAAGRAADHLLTHWPICTHWGDLGGPPDYVDAGGEYLSLSQVFQALAYSLAHYREEGRLPDRVTVKDIYGPVDTPLYREGEEPPPELIRSQGLPGCGNRLWFPVHTGVEAEDLLASVAEVAGGITNRIPAVIGLRVPAEASRERGPEKIGVCVNPAEFLYAMAQLYSLVLAGKKPAKCLLVAMKVIEGQPGGITAPGPAAPPRGPRRGPPSRPPAGPLRRQQVSLRHWVDPGLINAVWNYVPPRDMQAICVMSTIFTDVEGTPVTWRAYNHPGQGYDVGSNHERPRLRLPYTRALRTL